METKTKIYTGRKTRDVNRIVNARLDAMLDDSASFSIFRNSNASKTRKKSFLCKLLTIMKVMLEMSELSAKKDNKLAPKIGYCQSDGSGFFDYSWSSVLRRVESKLGITISESSFFECVAHLKKLGWISSQQLKFQTENGLEFTRSIKHILTKFFEDIGVYSALQAAHKAAFKKLAEKAAQLGLKAGRLLTSLTVLEAQRAGRFNLFKNTT